MLEIYINVKEEFKRGVVASSLPGAIPSLLLAFFGNYAAAYFLEMLSFSTIYSALFLKKLWYFKSFWLGLAIASIADLAFIFYIVPDGGHFPFFAFTPLIVFYCFGLVYGLRWLVSSASGAKICFVE